MPNIPIGIQLYSVRDDCARDLPGALAAIAKMGYAGVEFAGYHGRTAPELRQMLDDLGLKCCGTHIGLDTLLGDNFQPTVEFNLTLGNPYLVVPWIAEERRNTKDALQKTAELFNEIAVKLQPYGLHTGYHNHHTEFAPVEGDTGFGLLYSYTLPSVIMQLDTGNALHGILEYGTPGVVEYLRRFPKNAITVHLKEYSPTNDKAIIGEGDIPWQQVFDLCEASGNTEWYIVEQESYAFPPLECIAQCLTALKKMGK